MTPREREEMKARTELVTQLAALLFYWGFRIYGATKKHAWERARITLARACMDKAVEMTGVIHPDGVPPGHMQVTFEGGPAHREVRNVEDTDWIELQSDGRTFLYRRTDRKRGHSIVFELRHGMDDKVA